MKKVAAMVAFSVVLMIGFMFPEIGEAQGNVEDPRIEMLKKELAEIERKRDAELEILKNRIKALEQERIKEKTRQVNTPQTDVEELRTTVSELKREIEEQDSSFQKVTKFMEKHRLKAGLRLRGSP